MTAKAKQGRLEIKEFRKTVCSVKAPNKEIAALISAAPDMLKAIRNDHSNAGCVSYGFNDKNPCWHLKIINRATGA